MSKEFSWLLRRATFKKASVIESDGWPHHPLWYLVTVKMSKFLMLWGLSWDLNIKHLSGVASNSDEWKKGTKKEKERRNKRKYCRSIFLIVQVVLMWNDRRKGMILPFGLCLSPSQLALKWYPWKIKHNLQLCSSSPEHCTSSCEECGGAFPLVSKVRKIAHSQSTTV